MQLKTFTSIHNSKNGLNVMLPASGLALPLSNEQRMGGEVIVLTLDS